MHELTNKFNDWFRDSSLESMDKVIREWLKAKAEEVFLKAISQKDHSRDDYREILLLPSPAARKPEVESCVIHSDCERGVSRKSEPSVPGRESEWCEHIEIVLGKFRFTREALVMFKCFAVVNPAQMFCELCGKPRPEKRRALAEVLRNTFDPLARTNFKGSNWEEDWIKTADAAIKWFISLLGRFEKEIPAGSRHSTFSALKSELAKGGGA